MSNIRIMPAALEKMKKEERPYTIYLASRGG
jgi:hypothetical protein